MPDPTLKNVFEAILKYGHDEDFAPKHDEDFKATQAPAGTREKLEVLADRPAAPTVVPAGEERFTELSGESMQRDLATIVGFARESRANREIGEGMIWGRITGFPSGAKTIDWAVDQFRRAGIQDVELQRFSQPANAGLTVPVSWEVRLLGDPSFGTGSRDVVLESAMTVPLSLTNSEFHRPSTSSGRSNGTERLEKFRARWSPR